MAGKRNTFTFGRKPLAVTGAAARKLLSPEDRKALPILGKKCTDKESPQFGMWQEDRLVKHVIDRLRLSDTERRMRVQRMQEIDIQLSGYVQHLDKDKKIDRDNKKGRKPKPVEMSLPLAYSQIDDGVTYMMSLFAPEANIFVATSQAKKQSVAEGLTQEIGRQGQKLQYYRQVCKLCLNALKYNFGAVSVRWEKQDGKVFTADDRSNAQGGGITGQIKTVKGTVWEGNVLKSVDCYNFLFDTSVHPVDLPLRGEYFAEIELQTPFRIQRMAGQKILFGIKRYIDQFAALSGLDSGTFYIAPPVVRDQLSAEVAAGGTATNWQQVLAPGGPARESQPGIELEWFTGWLIPSDYSLSDSDDLECWQLCIANGKYLTSAYQIENSHGQLPVAAACPIEDDLRNDQRTYAEMLLPLQVFASFLLNTHIAATRKAIYGITVYDKNLFPGLDLSQDDLIGARIPMKSNSNLPDIDKAFRHYNDAPQTDRNVEMVGKIVELMQKILPTDMLRQVADLERATEYQAAATVQASSRRNLKIARIINDQCLSIIKFQMMYNIYENVTLIEYTDANGQTQKITPRDLLDAMIEFDVGTGLKGLDRLMQVSIFKDVMSYLFQVKDIGNQVDLLGLLSYVTQIAGFETDLSQFKLTAEQQAANAQPLAGQNGEQNTGQAQNSQGSPSQAPAPNLRLAQ